MSNLASGSNSTEDIFLEFDDDIIDSENIDEIASDSDNPDNVNQDNVTVNTHTTFLDARRRLEVFIEEKNLEKDTKEFDFDI